jgi:transposase-like protein
MRGRLDPEKIEAVASYVKRGVPIKLAAEAHGFDYREFAQWMRLGEDAQRRDKYTMHARLYEAVRQARAEFLASQKMILTKHAVGYRRQDGEHQEGDWKAAMEMLASAAQDDELERLRALTSDDAR